MYKSEIFKTCCTFFPQSCAKMERRPMSVSLYKETEVSNFRVTRCPNLEYTIMVFTMNYFNLRKIVKVLLVFGFPGNQYQTHTQTSLALCKRKSQRITHFSSINFIKFSRTVEFTQPSNLQKKESANLLKYSFVVVSRRHCAQLPRSSRSRPAYNQPPFLQGGTILD